MTTPQKILSRLPSLTDKKEVENLLKDVARAFSFAVHSPEGKEGAKAYREGMLAVDNPYERNDQAAYWLNGFMFEKKNNPRE
jgi:hypothetical protein